MAQACEGVTLRIEGNIQCRDDVDAWPLDGAPRVDGARREDEAALRGGKYVPFLQLNQTRGMHITGGGLIDGNGARWWNMGPCAARAALVSVCAGTSERATTPTAIRSRQRSFRKSLVASRGSGRC